MNFTPVLHSPQSTLRMINFSILLSVSVLITLTHCLSCEFAVVYYKMTLFSGPIVPALSVLLYRLIKATAFGSINGFWLRSNGTNANPR